MYVEHFDYPNHASVYKRMLLKIVSVMNSFITFTRASVATRVNEAKLIETVPVDHARMNYDPIALAQKGLLIEEEQTNILIRSNEITNGWSRVRSTVTDSTDFPIFANERGFLLTSDGTNGGKVVVRFFTSSLTTQTMSVYLRRGTNNFAQILTGGDLACFAIYDLLTGVASSIGVGTLTSAIISWRDG
jgi:hypothetical protein